MEKKQITVVTKAACPVCIMTKSEIERNLDKFDVKFLTNKDKEGKALISESGMRDAPLIKADGKFYSGKNAYVFIKSLS